MSGSPNPQSQAKAEQGRKVQDQVEAAEARSFPPKTPRAMQAGAREYPVPPFPRQHPDKSGSEAARDPQPMYDSPFWEGSEKLKDKVALITGPDSGIGRAVAPAYVFLASAQCSSPARCCRSSAGTEAGEGLGRHMGPRPLSRRAAALRRVCVNRRIACSGVPIHVVHTNEYYFRITHV